MALNPKTPTHRRGRSDAKTPLTPSLPVNSISASPPKPSTLAARHLAPKPSLADTSNPFLVRSASKGMVRTPAPGVPAAASAGSVRRTKSTTRVAGSASGSPVKRSTSTGPPAPSAALRRQASAGLIRKGGPEARMDVVALDYVPPPIDEKRAPVPPSGLLRSRSRSTSRVADRFIPAPNTVDSLASTLETVHLSSTSLATSSPGHTARLAAAAGVNTGRRILAYHELPPVAKDPLLTGARAAAAPLHGRPPALGSTTGATTNRTRTLPSAPERVLDAPGILDDFYLNVLAWSSQNVLAVGLGETCYAWRADSGDVAPLAEAPEGSSITSVSFAGDGAFLGVGLGTGAVELWDVARQKRLRVMAGHQAQVASLSWNGHVLSSGCHDGSVWHHDVRVGKHKVAELLGHAGEVCGLTWRGDGALLASGGNDNVVNIWDARLVQDEEGARGVAKWTKRSHTAAVKALAWCPWQPALLASGGGTHDASINVWNATTGARVHTLHTPAQVTALIWAPGRKELLSAHGYPTNALMVHAYPSLERVAEIRDAHDQRVLYAALGPAGDVVVTGAGDENLKFWRVWEPAAREEKKGRKGGAGEGKTDAGVLGLR